VTSAWIPNWSTWKSIVQIINLYGLKETIKHYILAKFEVKKDNFSKVISKRKFYIFSVNVWAAMFVSLLRGTKMADKTSKFKIVHSFCHKQSKSCHIIWEIIWSFSEFFAISGFSSYSVTAGVTQLLTLKTQKQNKNCMEILQWSAGTHHSGKRDNKTVFSRFDRNIHHVTWKHLILMIGFLSCENIEILSLVQSPYPKFRNMAVTVEDALL